MRELALFTDIHGIPRGKMLNTNKLSLPSYGCASGVLSKDILAQPVLFERWATPNGASDITFHLGQANSRRFKGGDTLLGANTVSIGSIVDTDGGRHIFDIRSRLIDLIRAHPVLGDVRIGAELEFFLGSSHKASEQIFPASHAYGVCGFSQNEDFIECAAGLLDSFDISWEHFCQENEKGQFEIALQHSPIVEMADRIILSRLICHVAAERCGTTCTFTPVRSKDEAPNNLHLHISVGDEQLAHPSIRHPIVDRVGRSIPLLLAIYRPTANGFRAGGISSFSSSDIIIDHNSRFTSIRLLSGAQDRFELRVPTSDCNPYLVFLMLSHLIAMDDDVDSSGKSMPTNFNEALTTLESSHYAQKVLGAEFLEAYRTIKLAECETLQKYSGIDAEFIALSKVI